MAWIWSARTPLRGLTVSRISICVSRVLPDTVEQIAVQAPGGFEWATAPDPTGAAFAEYFPSSTPGTGDLYLNPEVRSDLPPAGGTLPLGGSTGSLISLANGVVLTVTITYQGQSAPGHCHDDCVGPGFRDGSDAGDAVFRPIVVNALSGG